MSYQASVVGAWTVLSVSRTFKPVPQGFPQGPFGTGVQFSLAPFQTTENSLQQSGGAPERWGCLA